MKSVFKFFLVIAVTIVAPLAGIALLVLLYVLGRQNAHVDRIVQAILDPERDKRIAARRKIVVKKHDSSIVASVILGAVVVSVFLAIIV